MLPLGMREPTIPEGIDLRCSDARDTDWPPADLVLTDPPWTYHQSHGESVAADHYAGLSVPEIVAVLDKLQAPRLAMWCTWPLLGEWVAASRGWSWGEVVTGGAWVKSQAGDLGHYGPGYHWAGCSEFVLMYTKRSGHCDRAYPLRNAWIQPPYQHSRKPIQWQANMVQRWSPTGGLVLDPFSGLGSVAEAVLCAGDGRKFLGTEIDPERHSGALALIAQCAGKVGR
jgi:hypothetical protein